MMMSFSRTMEQFKMSSSQRSKTSFICTPLINYHSSSPKHEPQPIPETQTEIESSFYPSNTPLLLTHHNNLL